MPFESQWTKIRREECPKQETTLRNQEKRGWMNKNQGELHRVFHTMKAMLRTAIHVTTRQLSFTTGIVRQHE